MLLKRKLEGKHNGKIKPLTIKECEDIHTDAEFPSVGIGCSVESLVMRFANDILKLSQEIKRLS